MASVTMCDVCKKVYKHEECMRLELIHKNQRGGKGNIEIGADLCPSCIEKVTNFLGGKENGFQ